MGIPISAEIGLADDVGRNARAIIEALRRQAEIAAATAEARSRPKIAAYGERHTQQWVASVKVGAEIDVSKLLADDDLVDLVSIKTEEFSRLIKNLSEDVRNRIERETLGAIFEGRSNADIAKSIRDIEGIGRRRAKLIARDQASKLNGAMNEFRQAQAGVTHYKWKTIIDGRERPSHHQRNNQIFAWDKPPSGGHPGSEINCRCRALAVLIEDPADVETAGIGRVGDPGDPLDMAGNEDLLRTVAGTMGEDVMSWSREAALVRAAEIRRARDIVTAAKAEASFLEEQA